MKTIGLVAGPCSAESREQVLRTARELKEIGVSTLRAGLWKPRSRCGTFEGVGEKGLDWLCEVQQELGLRVMTEVALPSHVEKLLESGIDMLWIGARTTVNPFMMRELAESLRGCNIPVWVKNPVSPDIELWIGAIERLHLAGVKDVRIIHRGFCTMDSAPYRNAPLWELTDRLHTHFPNLPFYCDPSHIAGKRELLMPICEKAISLHVDGLFIESHCCPQEALSDAAQQLTPQALAELLNTLNVLIE
ncbi:phospho-2-dehydro-3-deoxyheptonate aldolase [uncultured Bacteroides sp.]|jgi:3-deoxy-D-arabino-heptulosonate 7-phosphate (DAHP) synthase|uniref:phospho-2-dehydro-3-deoxyheptonate aldolase n=2 Tax=uncultured Bacteroides sp. TaxID=162156 RepID=UPI0025D7116B|nr:phospho-2-dehydro-3-deoxyheptonate aldolase [uncultured Bacteroides sp.]